jgi:D-alanyl-D-alanine carboxypeptidase
MMKRFMIVMMLGAFLVSVKAVDGQSRSAQVDDYIKKEMTKLHIPGVSIALLRNGKVELLKGYGLANVESKQRVTPETMFQIASTTKPFTAMAIMMLAADGKLALDERAIKYLPWLPPIYPEVTVRQLLSHTSGVNRDVRTANVDNFTLDEFKRRFVAAPASFKPGERWEYSNNGYILLGMIVEALGEKSFGEFLTTRIFVPLGMKNTRFNEPPGKLKNRATGYDWQANAYQASPYFAGGYAGGALISTAADMAKWERALQSRKLLKESSYDEMWMPVKLPNGQPLNFEFRGAPSGYGYGWFLTSYKNHKLLTHGGTVSGFSSQIMRFVDDQLTIIVLTNSKSGADRIGYAEVLARGLTDLYF